MLFNSYEFILVFLPIVLAGYWLFGRLRGSRTAIAWLVLASLFFYGWWSAEYLLLLIGSILFNFGCARMLIPSSGVRFRRKLLGLGIACNLGLLGYFKYANFFAENIELLLGTELAWTHIVLPIAISFFTFQQIAYLVDTYRGETEEHEFLHYCLFVTFFPQLIAGPIVHHKEMLPQFKQRTLFRLDADRFGIGLTVFSIGLFKKVVLADNLALFATPIFDAADAGLAVTFYEAWMGCLAYTLQLYFDFSGYSDMAIGLGYLFGIRLPDNFNSPYKATSIIDFWRRWHMTLSRFLRDYLYIPLGGNRKGPSRRQVNLLITMLLGGLWHGAGWNFMLWGALHGVYLVINHGWHYLRGAPGKPTATGKLWAGGLTMLAVAVAWVPFRATTMDGVVGMLRSMSGVNGVELPAAFKRVLEGFPEPLSGLAASVRFGDLFPHNLIDSPMGALLIAIGLAIVWWLPNAQEALLRPERREQLWKLTARNAYATSALLTIALFSLNRKTEFLYFQF